MRSIWNGAISFGLVSIPIKLVNATENHAIHFRQIHLADGGRIRYRKVCELDEEEVSGGEIGKAYEDADGTMIPITDEDLAQLPLPTAKTIEIVAFVPADQIDPLQMDAAYYLSANGVPAAKPYTLLREALKRSNKVAVAKYALRGRERLGMLRVVDDVIAMHGLLWPDEIRAPEGVAPEGDVTVRDAELDLADALMDTLGEVDMDSLHDDYREAVEELIAAKASGEEVRPAESGGGRRRQGHRPDRGPGEQRTGGEEVPGRGGHRCGRRGRRRRGRGGHGGGPPDQEDLVGRVREVFGEDVRERREDREDREDREEGHTPDPDRQDGHPLRGLRREEVRTQVDGDEEVHVHGEEVLRERRKRRERRERGPVGREEDDGEEERVERRDGEEDRVLPQAGLGLTAGRLGRLPAPGAGASPAPSRTGRSRRQRPAAAPVTPRRRAVVRPPYATAHERRGSHGTGDRRPLHAGGAARQRRHGHGLAGP